MITWYFVLLVYSVFIMIATWYYVILLEGTVSGNPPVYGFGRKKWSSCSGPSAGRTRGATAGRWG
jgi:hypothetical protein